MEEPDNLRDSSQHQTTRLMPSWVADFGPSRGKRLSILFAQRDIFNARPKRIGKPVEIIGKDKYILTL